MTPQDFEAKLRADGYQEIETKRIKPNLANSDHGHPFSVRGLVLDGAFTVAIEGVSRTYRPGDIFEVGEGREHFETTGADGAEVVVGRKHG
jgi:quercetin dioxygenase-like cupin family protein